MRLRSFVFAALFLSVTPVFAAPAFACRCTPDADGARGRALVADPALSVADALVRAINPRNHQSMLEIKNLRSGGLAAQTIRAKFGSSSCAVVPRTGATATFLIRAEEDGSYSIADSCDSTAAIGALPAGGR